MQPEQQQQLADLLQATQSILVLFGPEATADQVACATALHFSVAEAGKDSRLLSPGSPDKNSPKTYKNLIGLDQVTSEMGNQNLCVSFDYDENAVDKVSYHIGEETNKFFLTIKPKKGSQPLSTDGVEMFYTGADADLIFTVGVSRLEHLEQLYYGFEDAFANVPVVALNTFQSEFGLIKIDLGGHTCMSEGLANVLWSLGYQIPADGATNLLHAIDSSTDHLRSLSATAQTFEVVSRLLQEGARRFKAPEPVVKSEKSVGASHGGVVKKQGVQHTVHKGQQKHNHRRKKKNQGGKNVSSKNQGGLSHQPSSFSPGGGG